MKRFIVLLVLSAAAYAVSAQVVVHDYLWISTDGGTIFITSTVGEEQVIVPPKEERRERTSMLKASMKVVQQYEANGWELFSFDTYQREQEVTARMIWVMRKPKQ